MSKNFQEPEEKDMDKSNNDAEIIDDFNPLDEPVIEKEYAKHNVKINPNDFKTEIPEPDFVPPPMTGSLTDEEKIKKPAEPFNPQMNEMSNKDKNDAARQFAEMIMGGYKMLNNYADTRLQINEKKLMQMQMSGEVDLSIPMPFSADTNMSAGEFIEEFNRQSKGTIYVSKQFEEETTPVLTRVLAKRGIGLTDEQYLAYLFGKDAITKTFLMNQSLSVKKDILNQLKEMTAAYRGVGNAGQSMPQSAPPPPSPSPVYQAEEEPVYEPEEEHFEEPKRYDPATNVNDLVGIMTGSITQEEVEQSNEYYEPKRQTKKPKSSGKRGRPKKK